MGRFEPESFVCWRNLKAHPSPKLCCCFCSQGHSSSVQGLTWPKCHMADESRQRSKIFGSRKFFLLCCVVGNSGRYIHRVITLEIPEQLFPSHHLVWHLTNSIHGKPYAAKENKSATPTFAMPERIKELAEEIQCESIWQIVENQSLFQFPVPLQSGTNWMKTTEQTGKRRNNIPAVWADSFLFWIPNDTWKEKQVREHPHNHKRRDRGTCVLRMAMSVCLYV